MNKTQIEWVKNPDGTQGYTFNPITGCLNHDYGLCKGGNFPCYAYRLATTRLRQKYLFSTKRPQVAELVRNSCILPDNAPIEAYNDPFYPRFWPERLEQIRKRKKPTGIFLDDMSDWMGDYWPEEWTQMELQVMRDCPQHRFYTLTKQPQNLIKFSPFPDNCWVGVTATSGILADAACAHLSRVEAKIKFISMEPLLDGWGEGNSINDGRLGWQNNYHDINWVIIGAQTKPYKPPKLEWVQEIALACTKAHIPLFIKDNLRPLLPNRMPFWCPVTWTELDKGVPIRMTENRLRQEMPKEGNDVRDK